MNQWKSFLSFLLYGEGRGPLGLWGCGDRFVGDKAWRMTTGRCWPPGSDGFNGALDPDVTKMCATSRIFHYKPVMMITWVLSDGTGGGRSLWSLHRKQGPPTGCGAQSEAGAADPGPPSCSAGLGSQMRQARCPSRGPAPLGREHLPALGPTLGVCLGDARGHVGWLSLP